LDTPTDDFRSPADPAPPPISGDPEGLPALEPFRQREKLELIAEILSDYVRLWGAIREKDVLEMAARARRVRPGLRSRDPREHLVARRLGKVVGKTLGVLPTDSRCLIRSLVLVRILARRSIPSVLVIGVSNDGGFKAHAWVEHEGRPILPPGVYTRLTEL
jgi:hypothetical protein